LWDIIPLWDASRAWTRRWSLSNIGFL